MKNLPKFKYTERDLVLEFCKVLRKQNLVFAVEVPFLNKSVDLVFYKDDKIKAVEFKLYNWKKAIEQAKKHSLGANEVYVCLPAEIYGNRIGQIKETFIENNCGLILFDRENSSIEEILSFKGSPSWEGGVAIMRKGVKYSLQNGNYNLLLGI